MDVIESIKRHDAGRDPERLRLKYKAMRNGAHAFLRGTCHLYYEHLPDAAFRLKAPPAWACGDLHLENFGTFKGDNRLEYFDINDFDEAALAPASTDLLRLMTSALVYADEIKLRRKVTIEIVEGLVEAYASALQIGKSRWIERETAKGRIGALLKGLRLRKRATLLDQRTRLRGKSRSIRIDGRRALVADTKDRARVVDLMRRFAHTQDDPHFFDVVDVARRIAGLGSLGVLRDVILIEGRGSAAGNYLLDLKQALPAVLADRAPIRQPSWANEAARSAAIQRRMQAVSPAFLHAIASGSKSFLLRELQPTDDRLNFRTAWTGKALAATLRTLGELLAWAQLRSSGREGSCTIDALIDFGRRRDWSRQLLSLATDSASTTESDWRTYVTAFDDGAFLVS